MFYDRTQDTQKIYRVLLDNVHVVSTTLHYPEAKEEFYDWVEEVMQKRVYYRSVQVTCDHQLLLEYGVKNND